MNDHMDDDVYCIIRVPFDGPSTVIRVGLDLDDAQAHCRRDDTRGVGWFDAYTAHSNRPHDVAAFIDACDHTSGASLEVTRGDDTCMESVYCDACGKHLGSIGY